VRLKLLARKGAVRRIGTHNGIIEMRGGVPTEVPDDIAKACLSVMDSIGNPLFCEVKDVAEDEIATTFGVQLKWKACEAGR
jgi:hypothetical protein